MNRLLSGTFHGLVELLSVEKYGIPKERIKMDRFDTKFNRIGFHFYTRRGSLLILEITNLFIFSITDEIFTVQKSKKFL